jgi:hypothetical protein
MVTRLLSTDFYWFVVSPCLEIAECRRSCVSGYGLLLVGRLSSCREIAREARVFGSFLIARMCLCPKNVEAGRAPVFWDFLTARMSVHVGRLPEAVLWKESCVGHRWVFGEWLIVFNCGVLTFWKGNKFPSWIESLIRYNIDRRFRGDYCFHHKVSNGRQYLQAYSAQHPRWQQS